MKQRMIFHMPLPLKEDSLSASGIRPRMMVDAFEKLGYEIHLITGYAKERKKQFKVLKRNIKKGFIYDFMYSESSTQPTALTEQNHLPVAPNLENKIYKFCKLQSIKIGLFYRDIHWVFPFYGESLSKFKKRTAIYFYKRDLRSYEKYLDILYLPSMEMAKYIPNERSFSIEELPPAHNLKKELDTPIEKLEKIKLLYIGGLGGKYNLHKLFEGIKGNDDVECIVSTRAYDWDLIKSEYSFGDNVEIVYKSGKDLDPLYEKSNLSLLFVKPEEYWEFAVPYKLFEYIEKGIPIIASEGTLVSNIIKENNFGWVIPYDTDELRKLLIHLSNNTEEIIEKTKLIRSSAMNFTWKKRAQKVINDLT